jgi:hypothetical protein
LDDRLLVAVQRDLQKVSDVRVTGARGLDEQGKYQEIKGGQIRRVVLFEAVPESQANIAMSSSFQRMLVILEEENQAEIEIACVRNWIK